MEFYLGIIFFLIGGVGLIQEVYSFKRKGLEVYQNKGNTLLFRGG